MTENGTVFVRSSGAQLVNPCRFAGRKRTRGAQLYLGSFWNERLTATIQDDRSLTSGSGRRYQGIERPGRLAGNTTGQMDLQWRLECNNAMNEISAEDAELTLVVAAEIDEAAAALAGTGQGHLVNRSHARPIFILKQNHGLTRHRGGETKVSKLDDFAAGFLLEKGRW
jgi:hypothetical protein